MSMIQYMLEDGTSIWIEVPSRGLQDQSGRKKIVGPQALKPELLDTVKNNIRLLRDKLKEIPLIDTPKEVEVELALKFDAAAGVFGIAQTSLEAGYVVKVKWVNESTTLSSTK